MEKSPHPLKSAGWNYLPIHELLRFNRGSFEWISISSHTLMDICLLIHAGIKVNPCYWKVPLDAETHFCAHAWWRHQMETFIPLLVICVGNSPASGEFPAQRPVTWSFDVFFDLYLNKRLRKQSWGWLFETLSRPYDVIVMGLCCWWLGSLTCQDIRAAMVLAIWYKGVSGVFSSLM